MTKTPLFLLLPLAAVGATREGNAPASVSVPSSTPAAARLSDRDELARIVAQRERNLRNRADLYRDRYGNGLSDYMAVMRAAGDLLVFRRDRAATLEEKIRRQEELVRHFAECVAYINKQCSGGAGDRSEVMDAMEQELAARQQLLEWKILLESSRTRRHAAADDAR